MTTASRSWPARAWRPTASRSSPIPAHPPRRVGPLIVDRGQLVRGADATGGSGLTGLADRVRAQGGTLSVMSPPVTGTTVRAVLPLSGGA